MAFVLSCFLDAALLVLLLGGVRRPGGCSVCAGLLTYAPPCQPSHTFWTIIQSKQSKSSAFESLNNWRKALNLKVCWMRTAASPPPSQPPCLWRWRASLPVCLAWWYLWPARVRTQRRPLGRPRAWACRWDGGRGLALCQCCFLLPRTLLS